LKTCSLVALLAGLAYSQSSDQASISSRSSEALPDDFIPKLEKVVQSAREGSFETIKGAPLPGVSSSLDAPGIQAHKFRWYPKIVLPGGRNCAVELEQVVMTSVDDAVTMLDFKPASYSCHFASGNGYRYLEWVQAVFGPGYVTETEKWGSRNENDYVSLRPVADKYTTVASIVYGPTSEGKASQCPAPCVLLTIYGPKQPIQRIVNTGVADDISLAISRIKSSQHTALPLMQLGSDHGPITVHNDTSSILTVYFLGGNVRRKAAIPPGGRTVVALSPGTYEVAGELSDQSALLFFGVRNYSGGETETFHVAPR
jgi:hypothetical protein